MMRCLLIALISLCCIHSYAQESDSLFAVRKGKTLALKYMVQPRETQKMLAKRFYVSEGQIEYINDADELKKLTTGSIIYIPVNKDNYFTAKPNINTGSVRELYYHVAPKDEIGILSTYLGITKTEFRTWNNLHGNTLQIDQVLFMGFVKMMEKDTTDPATWAAYPRPPKKKVVVAEDTVKVPVLGGLDTTYNRQTSNGINVLTEKGTAVFFEKPGKPAAYLAFHNSTPRGTIIKVFNPGTGKTIYAKVLGPLPNTKLYAGSIIGICDAAKEALGINESKAWCELTYTAEQ